jgi:hypothetical protein
MITGYFSADVKSLKYIKLSRGGIIMPVAYVHISMYCAAHACAEKKKAFWLDLGCDVMRPERTHSM